MVFKDGIELKEGEFDYDISILDVDEYENYKPDLDHSRKQVVKSNLSYANGAGSSEGSS